MRAKSDKTDKAKVVYDGKFLRFVIKGEWEYIERNNCSGVVIIVATTDDDRVIFVEQYRPPIDSMAIEFPAGLANDRGAKTNESIVTAAKRELLEETGYQAKELEVILEGPVSSGSCADIVTIVRARGLSKVAGGGGDEFESIVVHEVPVDHADKWLTEMKEKGYMVEPKIYAGLYFLKTYNRESSDRNNT